MKLEDMLKKQGFTEADMQAANALLSDAKFRGAVETYVGGLETDLTAFRTENDRWADWAEKVNKPQVDSLGREKLDLTGKVGSLEARLKALDPTFTPGTLPPPERKADGLPEGFDPKKHGLVTLDDVNQYAAAQGEAIAIANDLRAEYARLTGSEMLDYSTRTQDGRELRGMQALLHEARTQKRQLPDYIANKFDFAGKRAKASEDSRKAAEDAIRKDERTKVVAEFGNPNTRPGVASTNPFIPQKKVGDGAAKMPWETPASERRNSRINRALETQARSTVQ